MISSPKTRLHLNQTTDLSQQGGTGSNLANDTIYRAAADGLLYVAEKSDNNSFEIRIGTATPPTSIRGIISVMAGAYSSVIVPIAKNEYWSVVQVAGTLAADSIVWRPLK